MSRTATVALAHDVEGDGPVVLAVHGITEDRTFWERVPLIEHFRVIRVDLRGHGESSLVPPYDALTLADDVHALVEALGLERPVVVGHSYGGVVATAYAAEYPVRGVVNVDQSLDVSPLPEPVANAVRGEGFADFMTGFFAQFYGDLDPAVAADLQARRRARQGVVLGAWEPLLEMNAAELAGWLEIVTAVPPSTPYLALHGLPYDPDYPAWLRRRIPGAVVEQAPTATHYPHLADPAWFVRRLREFVGATDDG